MNQIFLGLGSNLGDRLQHLHQAKEALQRMPLFEMKCSSVYESLPYQGMKQPLYCNQVIYGVTPFPPGALLENCLKIERAMGRIRTARWAPRTIDIDILFYENQIIETESLSIPHKDFANRSFVLFPLVELDPNWIDPRSRKSLSNLLKQLKKKVHEELPQIIAPP
ncbi:2-amino-4-hydroxy-6-hydroxymethyldihydropteridine diphosphokinase [Deltaproteobacteria bacterium TL4]